MKFDTGAVNHSLIVGYETSRGSSRNDNGGLINGSELGPYSVRTQGPLLLQNLINAKQPQGYVLGIKGYSEVNAFYAAEQAAAFNDRLRFLLGVRRTNQQTYSDSAPKHIKAAATTPQFGLLVRPFPTNSPFKDTGIFANYSKSFEPANAVDGAGNPVPPSDGEGTEIGIKMDCFDGKLSGTLSYFEVTKSNVSQVDAVKGAQTGIIPSYNLGGVLESKGAELELFWNATKRLQLVFAYTWIPTAEYSSFPTVPQNIGLRLGGTPVHQANLKGGPKIDSSPRFREIDECRTGTASVLGFACSR